MLAISCRSPRVNSFGNVDVALLDTQYDVKTLWLQ